MTADPTDHHTSRTPSPRAERRTLTNWGSVRVAVDLVAGKWELAVIAALADGTPRRQAAIHRLIGTVSLKVLNQTLRRMHDAGLITRVLIPGHAAAVGYTLTPAGQALLPPLTNIGTWLDAHRRHLSLRNPVPGHSVSPPSPRR